MTSYPKKYNLVELLTVVLLLSTFLFGSALYLTAGNMKLSAAYVKTAISEKSDKIAIEDGMRPIPNDIPAFDDVGHISKEALPNTEPGMQWKFGNNLDNIDYLLLANGQDPGPPFRYRVLGPRFAKIISDIVGVSVSESFILINSLSVIFAGFLIYVICCSSFGLTPPYSLLAAASITSVPPITGTVWTPSIDPMTILVSTLLAWMAIQGYIRAFFVASALSMLLKEVFLVHSLVFFAVLATSRISGARKSPSWTTLTTGFMLSPMVFASIRLLHGDPAFSINYGYDLSRLELPSYALRLSDPIMLVTILGLVAVAFGVIWLGALTNFARLVKRFQVHGLPGVLRERYDVFALGMTIGILGSVIIASSKITRPLGILFPFIVPYFFTYVANHLQKDGLSS